MASPLLLVLGGTRSGKSKVAEGLAARAAAGAPVTYLATSVTPDLGDDAMAARIAAHRDRRPASWTTIECGAGLVEALLAAPHGTVLVDSLGTWVAAQADLRVDAGALVAALRARHGTTIVVSEEVGFAVHPETEIGRRFVDVIGELNSAVADAADRVALVVAGRVVWLPRDEAP